jgi:hypothetical protein
MPSNENVLDTLLKLPALGAIDPQTAADEYFANHVGKEQDATRRVTDVVDTSNVIAIDMMWPSILDAARRLPALGAIEFGDWRIRPIVTGVHSEAFVIEQILTSEGEALHGNGGGYVFHLKLERIMSEEGEKKIKELDREEIDSGDPAERRNRLVRSMFHPSPARAAVEQDPANYLPKEFCTEVEEITCIAFKSKTGRNPEGYDGYDSFSDDLEKILASGFEGYQHGEIFEYHPSRLSPDGDESPSLPSSWGLRNTAAAAYSMRTLSEALSALGYGADIAKRTQEHGDVHYLQYSREAGCLLRTIGAGAVFRDGGQFGEHAHAAAIGFLTRTATSDISRRMGELGELANYLEEGGHTTPDNEYECNDADDFGHIVGNDDGTRSLFIRTQHNQYRIDIVEEEGRIAGVSLGIIPEDQFDAPMPYVGDKGFLGYFAADEDGMIIGHNVDLLHMTRLLGFNDLAFTIESMHCCWEEEHGQDEDPETP